MEEISLKDVAEKYNNLEIIWNDNYKWHLHTQQIHVQERTAVGGGTEASFNGSKTWVREMSPVNIVSQKTYMRFNSENGFIEYSFDGGNHWVAHQGGSSLTDASPNSSSHIVSQSTHIGQLSAAQESRKNDPGTVSTGNGDPGSVSYGTYQMTSKKGIPADFLKNEDVPS